MGSIIFNDLRESTYKVNYDELEFVFSSEFYKNNFIDKMSNVLKIESAKLYAKYNTSINADYLILIDFYKKIEKRGFLINYNGKPLKNYSFLAKIELNN